MSKRCKNCGFIFERGIKKMSSDAYMVYEKEVCPKCGSDALEDLKERSAEE